MTSERTPAPDMAEVKSQCVTAVATVAGWSGILMTWFLGVFHWAAACAEGLLTIGCGLNSTSVNLNYLDLTFNSNRNAAAPVQALRPVAVAPGSGPRTRLQGHALLPLCYVGCQGRR